MAAFQPTSCRVYFKCLSLDVRSRRGSLTSTVTEPCDYILALPKRPIHDAIDLLLTKNNLRKTKYTYSVLSIDQDEMDALPFSFNFS